MNRTLFILSITTGLLFPMGFAPISLPGLALLSIAILFSLLEDKSPTLAFKIGWLYGIGKYGLGVSWIYVCIANFSNAPEIIALLATGLFIAFLACYEALFAWFYTKLFHAATLPIKLLGFSLLAILLECLRSYLFTGFPWLLLGHSLIDTPLRSLAPIIGSLGLGFIGFCLAVLLAVASRLNKKRLFILFILPFLIVKPLTNIQWTTSYATPLKVSMIQGNVSEKRKWVNTHLDEIIDRYVAMTEDHWQSDLIIWPETALPIPSNYIKDALSDLSKEAKKHNTQLLIGIPYSKKGGELSNSMMLLGKEHGLYQKQHLVPFGEYIPLNLFKVIMRYFNIPLGQLNPGGAKQIPISFNHIHIAPFICYEIAFSHFILPHLPIANILVTLSDDSWYGHSFAKAQHLQIARMRSLESGRFQLFSTNNGITAVINDKGDVIKQLPDETINVLQAAVELRTGYTPWGHFGDKPIILVFLILFMGILIFQAVRRNCRASA